MEKVNEMTAEERRTEIAYHLQTLENLKGCIPDRQWYEEKGRRNKRIRELEGAAND